MNFDSEQFVGWEELSIYVSHNPHYFCRQNQSLLSNDNNTHIVTPKSLKPRPAINPFYRTENLVKHHRIC